MPGRSLELIQADIGETLATIARLSQLINKAMATIRAGPLHVTKQAADHHGTVREVKVLNPAFKELREYNATLRAAEVHLRRLQAEERALLAAEEKAADVDPYSFLDKEQK